MDESHDLYSAADFRPEAKHSQNSSRGTTSETVEKGAANNNPSAVAASASSSRTIQADKAQVANTLSSLSSSNGHMAIPYTDDHPEMVELDIKHQCVAFPHMLSDPLQTPCGHRLCSSCLDIVLDGTGSVPCPAKEESCVILSKENMFPDYGARREIRLIDVYCIYRIYGCSNIVQFKDLKKHTEECAFKPVECIYKAFGCQKKITKDTFKEHVKKCNHEPIKCQQCGIETPKCDQKDHLSNECYKGKTRCPHNCGETNIPRDRLADHISSCRLKPSFCSFKSLGCDFKGSRDAMETHNIEQMKLHLIQTQVALEQKNTQIQSLSQKLVAVNEVVDSLNANVQKCNTEIERFSSMATMLDQKFRDMTKMLAKQGVEINKLEEGSKHFASKDQLVRHERELTALKGKVTSQEAAVSGLQTRPNVNIPDAVWTKMSTYERQIAIQQVRLAEAALRFHCLETTNYNGVLYWKISEYSRKKAEAVSGRTLSIYSQPFFTSRYGYKMCARIYLNGDGQGKGTHLSVFFLVMRGEFDALLKWPFRQRVTLTLIDQSGRRHVSDTFRPNPTSSSFKKPETEMNIASGCPLFAAHSMVEKAPFLKDDTIFIKVLVDTSDLEI